MAILNNLIVNGAARFLNGIRADSIHTKLIDAHDGIFKTITTTTLDAETVTTDMLKANNARVSQTLTVDGTISTNKWEAANIANIGGNFYISPTGKSDSGNITVTKTSTTTINGVSVGVYTLVVSGTFDVTSTSSTIWGTNSKVIFTGSISYPKMTGTDLTTTGKKYPLGTCDGTMSAVSTGTNTLTGFTITGVNSPALDIFFKEMGVTSISSTACSGYEMQISVYQSYYSSAQHPIGILLTSYGKEKKQYIDIYGGANAVSDSASGFAEPSVRVGQLDGLSDLRDGVTDASSPTKPSGWGIYTSNGFFKGKVVANAGIIGSGTKVWTIGNDGNNRSYIYSGPTSISGTTAGTYVGTDGFLNYNSGTQYVKITGGVITAQGANIQGVLNAGAGSTIGPWTVSSDAIYNPSTKSSLSSDTIDGVYLGKDGITLGKGVFKVTNAGALTAKSGTIGGINIGATYLTTNISRTTYDGTATGLTITSTGIGAGNGSTNTFKVVASTGVMTTTGANLLTATVGNASNKITIGTGTSGHSSIRYGMTTLADTTNNGFYIGTDGIALGKGVFKVTDAGVLNATGATLTNLTIKNSATGTPTIGTFDTNGITLYDQAGTQRIKITSSGGVVIGKASGKGRIEVTDSGMNIYNASGTQTSSFGDSITLGSNAATVTIGKVAANNYNTVINNQGMTINDNATPIAQFSSSGARIGKTGVGYIDIKSTGLDVYSGNNNVNLVHFGYDSGTDSEGGTSIAPYYTLGTRKNNSAIGNFSIAEGLDTAASGHASHAEGFSAEATGYQSHAEGSSTLAEGESSHAEGAGTWAKGDWSHAEGGSSYANGDFSHAGGNCCKAESNASFAMGHWVTAYGPYQTAIGKYNKTDTSKAFIIGNGTGASESARSNALTVDWDGNVNIASGAKYKINGTNLAASDVGAVPTSRTVNSKALSSNITLTASDVSALPLSGGTLTGRLTLNTFNTAQVNMRPSHASYDGIMSYQTAGNEAWVFSTKNAVTSFMFVNGEDTVSNASDSRWKSLTPGLQIKNNCVSIGKLIGDGVTPSYKLDVNGTVNFTDLGTNAITATKGLFALTSNTIFSSKTMAAGNVQNSTAVFSKSGYYPLGIAGWSTDSGDINAAQLYLSSKSNDSATVTYIFKNVGSTSRTVTAKVDILWIKYS